MARHKKHCLPYAARDLNSEKAYLSSEKTYLSSEKTSGPNL